MNNETKLSFTNTINDIKTDLNIINRIVEYGNTETIAFKMRKLEILKIECSLSQLQKSIEKPYEQ